MKTVQSELQDSDFKLWSGSRLSFSCFSDCPYLAVIHRWQKICNQWGLGLTDYIKPHDFSHPFFACRSSNWLLLSYNYTKLNTSSKWEKVISRFFPWSHSCFQVLALSVPISLESWLLTTFIFTLLADHRYFSSNDSIYSKYIYFSSLLGNDSTNGGISERKFCHEGEPLWMEFMSLQEPLQKDLFLLLPNELRVRIQLSQQIPFLLVTLPLTS